MNAISSTILIRLRILLGPSISDVSSEYFPNPYLHHIDDLHLGLALLLLLLVLALWVLDHIPPDVLVDQDAGYWAASGGWPSLVLSRGHLVLLVDAQLLGLVLHGVAQLLGLVHFSAPLPHVLQLHDSSLRQSCNN